MIRNFALSIARGIAYIIFACTMGHLAERAGHLLHLAREMTFSYSLFFGVMLGLTAVTCRLAERHIFKKLWQKDSGPHWLIGFLITIMVMVTLAYLLWPYFAKTPIRGSFSLWYMAGVMIGILTTDLGLGFIAGKLKRRFENHKLNKS